jgi:hypothetical protein
VNRLIIQSPFRDVMINLEVPNDWETSRGDESRVCRNDKVDEETIVSQDKSTPLVRVESDFYACSTRVYTLPNAQLTSSLLPPGYGIAQPPVYTN